MHNFMRTSQITRWQQSMILLLMLATQPSISSLQRTPLPVQTQSTGPPAQVSPTSPPARISRTGTLARMIRERSSAQALALTSSRTPRVERPALNRAAVSSINSHSPINISSAKGDDTKNPQALSYLQSLMGEGKSNVYKKPMIGSLLSLISSVEEQISGSDENGAVEAYASDDDSLPLLALVESSRTQNPTSSHKPWTDTGLLRKIIFRNNSHPPWKNKYLPSPIFNSNRTTSFDSGLQTPFLMSTHGSHISQIGSPGKYTHRRLWPDFHISEKPEDESSLLEHSSEVSASSIETSSKMSSNVKLEDLKQRLNRVVIALGGVHPSLKTVLNLESFEYFEETPLDIGTSHQNNASSANSNDTSESLNVLPYQELYQMLSNESVKFRTLSMNRPLLPKFRYPGQEEAVEIAEEIPESKLLSSYAVLSSILNDKINSTSAPVVLKPLSSINRMLDLINKQNLLKKTHSQNFSDTEFEADASTLTGTVVASPSSILTRSHGPKNTHSKEIVSKAENEEQLPQHLPLISQANYGREGKSKTSDGFLNPEASVFGTDKNLSIQDDWYDYDSSSYDDYYLYDTKYLDSIKETKNDKFLSYVNDTEDHGISGAARSIEGDKSVFHKASDPNVLAEHPLSGQVLSKSKQNSHHSSIPSANGLDLSSKFHSNSNSNSNLSSTGASNTKSDDDSMILSHQFSTDVSSIRNGSISFPPNFNPKRSSDTFPASNHPTSQYFQSPVTATSRSMTGDALTFLENERNSKRLTYDSISLEELNDFSLSNKSIRIDSKTHNYHGPRMNNIIRSTSFGNKLKFLENNNVSLNDVVYPNSSRPIPKHPHPVVFRASPSTADPALFTPSLYDVRGLGNPPEIQLSTPGPLTNVPALTTMPRKIFRVRTNTATNFEEKNDLPSHDGRLDFPLLPFNVTRRPNFFTSTPFSTSSHVDYTHPYSLQDSSSITRYSSTPSPKIFHFSTSGTIAEPHLPVQPSTTHKPTTLQQLLLDGYTLNPSVSSLTYHELGALQAHNSGLRNLVVDARPPPSPKLMPPSNVRQNLHFDRGPQIGSSGLWNYPIHQHPTSHQLPVQHFVEITPQPRVLQPLQPPQNFLPDGGFSIGNGKSIYDNILSHQLGFDKHNFVNSNHGRNFGQIPQNIHDIFVRRQISPYEKSILDHQTQNNIISSYTSYNGERAPVTKPSSLLNFQLHPNPHKSMDHKSNPIRVPHDNSFLNSSPATGQVSHSHVTHLSPVHQILQNPISPLRSDKPGGSEKSHGILPGTMNFSHAFHYGSTFPGSHLSQSGSQAGSGSSFSKALSPSSHHGNSSQHLKVFVSPLRHFGQTVPHLSFKTISGHYPGQDLLPEVYQFLYPTSSPRDQRGKSSLSSSTETVTSSSAVVQPLQIKNLKEIIIDEKGRLIEETFYIDNIEGGESEENTAGRAISSDTSFEIESNLPLTSERNHNVDPFLSASPTASQQTNDHFVNSHDTAENLNHDQASERKKEKKLLEVVGKEGTFTTKNFIEDFISVTPLGEQEEVVSDAPPRVDLSAIGNLLRPLGTSPEPDEISVFTTLREALRGIASDPSYLAFPEERFRNTVSDPQAFSRVKALQEDPTVETHEPFRSPKSHEFFLIVTDARSRISPGFDKVSAEVAAPSVMESDASPKGNLEERIKLDDILKKLNEATNVQKLSFSSSHVFRGELDLDTPSFRRGFGISKSTSDQASSNLDVGSQNAISVLDAISFLETSFGNMRNDSLQLLLNRFSDASQLIHLDTPVYIWRPGPRNAFGLRLLDDMHFIIPSVSTSTEFPRQKTTVDINTPTVEESTDVDTSFSLEINEQSLLPRKKTLLAESVINSSSAEQAGLDYLDNFDTGFEGTVPSISFEDTSSEIENGVSTEASVSISSVSVIVPALADDFIHELEKLFIFSESGELINSPLNETSKIFKKVLKGDQETNLKLKKFPGEFHSFRTLLLTLRNRTSLSESLFIDKSNLREEKFNLTELTTRKGELGKNIPAGFKVPENKSNAHNVHHKSNAENPHPVEDVTISPTEISFTHNDNSADVSFSATEKHPKEFAGLSMTREPNPETGPIRTQVPHEFDESVNFSFGQKLTDNAHGLLNTAVLAQPLINSEPSIRNVEFGNQNMNRFTTPMNDGRQLLDDNALPRILDTTAFVGSATSHQSTRNNVHQMNTLNSNTFTEPTIRFQASTGNNQTSLSDVVPTPSTLSANSQRKPEVTLSKVLIPQDPILLFSDDAESQLYLPEPVTGFTRGIISTSNGHMAPFPIFNERLLNPPSSIENSKTEFLVASESSMHPSYIKRHKEHTEQSQNSENDSSHTMQQPVFGEVAARNFDLSEYFPGESYRIERASLVVSASTEPNFSIQPTSFPSMISKISRSIPNATQSTTHSGHFSTRTSSNVNNSFAYSSPLPADNFYAEFPVMNFEHRRGNENATPLDKNWSLPVTKNTLSYISNSLSDKEKFLTKTINETEKRLITSRSSKSTVAMSTKMPLPWKPDASTTSAVPLQTSTTLFGMKTPMWKPNMPPSLGPKSGAGKKNLTSTLRQKRTGDPTFAEDVENADKLDISVEVDRTGSTNYDKLNKGDKSDKNDRFDGPSFTDIERMGEGSFIPVSGPYGSKSTRGRLALELPKILLPDRLFFQTREDKITPSYQIFEPSTAKSSTTSAWINRTMPNGIKSKGKTLSGNHASNELFQSLERENANEGLRKERLDRGLLHKTFHRDSARSNGDVQNVSRIVKTVADTISDTWRWYS